VTAADVLTAAELPWWHPRLAASRVNTPLTRVAPPPPGGVPPDGEATPAYGLFLGALEAAGDAVGWPCVLRTGLAAAKHLWRSACLVGGPAELDARVRATAAWCRRRGLPVRAWAVRQYVPLAAAVTVYDGLPVAREVRVFTRGGEPLCLHAYWTRRAVELGRPAGPWLDAYDRVCEPPDGAERRVLLTLAAHAGRHLPGLWATDWAATLDGRWVALDAAPGDLAWHAPTCPHHPARPGRLAAPPVPPADYRIDPASAEDAPLRWQLDQNLDDDTLPEDAPCPPPSPPA
jgi:hypothetical protein